MLSLKERDRRKVFLEFLCSILPIFEDFPTVFQKNTPQVHILYDSMCDLLLKVLRHCMKSNELKKYGSELASVDCSNVGLQLTDKNLIIGDTTRQTLSKLEPDAQKAMLLGIQAFFIATVSHLQTMLPLNNRLLKDLGFLNPSKKQRGSTLASIQNLARKLQPSLDLTCIHDEWKMYQADPAVPQYDPKQRVYQN